MLLGPRRRIGGLVFRSVFAEDWFCVLQPVAVRAAPRESAARRCSLVAGQRIQARVLSGHDSSRLCS